MTDFITKHEAAKLANLHSDIMVFLETGQTLAGFDIEKTAKEYFTLTARLGVVLHNDSFERYVERYIRVWHERKRKAFQK
jgi:hypothetical protein